jgi:hypothetical protein
MAAAFRELAVRISRSQRAENGRDRKRQDRRK